LVLSLLFAGCKSPSAPVVPEGPVEWSASASVDKSEVQVGEDLTLTIAVRHPPEGRFVTPPDTAFAPFDVIGKTEEAVSPVETHLRVRLAAYRLPGEVEIPTLQIPYQKDGAVDSLALQPIPVTVVTSLTPEVTDIHDIKEPVDLEVPRDFRLFWWLLAALLAALIAYLIYRKLRKEPDSVKSPIFAPPLPPPDFEAEAALKRLEEKDLIRKGEMKTFYTELSEIMKRYAGRRFEVPYLERTTSEVLLDLKPKKLAPDVHSELRRLLEASDTVKFAKLIPESAQADDSLARARRWIDSTRPVPERAIA
jgi:hypothetical protein